MFQPEFLESGESQFIDKLMVVVHRDMKEALDFFDRLDHEGVLVDNLPDFAAMFRGAQSVFRFPLLTLAVERMASTDSESGEWLGQELIVGAGIVVDYEDSVNVHKRTEKYARAFKALVRRNILECLPSVAGMLDHTLDITNRYLRFAEAKSGIPTGRYVQALEVEIKVKFGEK